MITLCDLIEKVNEGKKFLDDEFCELRTVLDSFNNSGEVDKDGVITYLINTTDGAVLEAVEYRYTESGMLRAPDSLWADESELYEAVGDLSAHELNQIVIDTTILDDLEATDE